MYRKVKRCLVWCLTLALTLGTLVTGASPEEASAAGKIKLSKKKITVKVGKSKKVKVKKTTGKKVKWKIKNSKIASIKKAGKKTIKVKGLKKGKTTLICKVKKGKKWIKLKCKVKVKKKASKSTTVTTTATPSTDATATPVATESPSASATTDPDAFTPIVYKSADFESGTDGFTGRGSASVSTVTDGHTGSALSVTGRTATWNGALIDVTDTIVKGATYTISAWVKQSSGSTQSIKISADLTVDSTTTYPAIAQLDCEDDVWTYIEGTYTVPESFDTLYLYFEGPDGTYDFLVDDVVITQITEGVVEETIDTTTLASLKDTYADIFEHMGNVLSYSTSWNNGYQMQQESTMEYYVSQYNSFTLENELKPEQILNSYSGTITVSEAKNLGYVIPDDYTEDVVPKLNFDNLDKILEIANKYGLQMRGHTLMWHQQTSPRFFLEDYSSSSTDVVSTSVMDARIKFYVETVMKHVMDKEVELTGEAGTIVYAWDVTNEYVHRSNSSTSTTWTDVYGDMGLEPTYVKLAYETAYNMLKEYGVEDDVTLFYNDYNEYDCADDIISLIDYINDGEEANICGGIGMQSHITISYPSITKYGEALDKFLATGLEVQVTELDIGIESGQTESDQADRYKDIFSLLISKQKNRDTTVSPKGITGVTIWGLYDTLSWRSSSSPLLFGSSISDPKEAFYSVIEAATE